ncbi:glycosyltransferase family 2 protein (plasmid) [Vibrio sp. SS-MA-C1-2]|uniref:glycosyltransferase family 2 protein n=1 Tax=Vibrio sp. SS-MA-C1-2 TaxID=2908646 RepID=UPI001F354800|nr:glycosyltransferase family 2 protein [Vibrio sp. SS-MA-C1-2]UJF17107.1 glycosyltransferase family 2 protein [Vibrio sp. SS-MA-C1-2]UJF20258.1 glycosyltransferase family 2 protein [Vibrio sp. SS-MA-C1-2]
MTELVSVVIPAKNEQGNIGQLITEIHQALNLSTNFEIVITDDGSTDNTVTEALSTAKALNCSLQIIKHQYSCGQSTAVHSAVKNAKGSVIVTLDADGQNNPADIPEMLELTECITNHHYCIAGYRNKRKDTQWIRFQSKVANKIRQSLLNDGVPDSGCGLKIFPRDTFLALPYFDHMHRFLPALIKRIGGEINIFPVDHRDRMEGTSNYTAWNRVWVGIVDIIGVMWLVKRAKKPTYTIEHVE